MSVTDYPFATVRTTQKLHLNVTNVAQDPPDTRPPCRAVFRLYDSEGNVAATSTSMLEGGKTVQVVTNPPDIRVFADSPDTRFEGVRGELLVTQGHCSNSIVGSMEIIDTASGEVRAIIAPTRSNRTTEAIVDAPDTTPQVS